MTYTKYVRMLGPALWFRLNEPGGTTVAINSGALGAAYHGVYTACTLAQPGKMSPTGAVLFDGATSKIVIPAGAYANYPAMTVAALVKLNSAGEGSLGTLFDWSQTTVCRFNTAMTALRGTRDAATDAATNTNTLNGVDAATWTWIFWTYDDAGDKKVYLTKGINSAATAYGYSTQTAAVGALADLSAVALTLGNNAGASRTLDGLYDEYLLFNKVLTPVQMTEIVRLTGV